MFTQALSILNFVCNTHYPRLIYVGNGSAIHVVTSRHSIFPIPNIYRSFQLKNVLVTSNIIKNLYRLKSLLLKITVLLNLILMVLLFLIIRFVVLSSVVIAPPLYPVTSSHAFVSISPTIWHQRIGHSDDQVLKHLSSSSSISCLSKNNVTCHAYQLGKHYRIPFYLSNSIVSLPFEIIHSD